jgi:hypothetical protein
MTFLGIPCRWLRALETFNEINFTSSSENSGLACSAAFFISELKHSENSSINIINVLSLNCENDEKEGNTQAYAQRMKVGKGEIQ